MLSYENGDEIEITINYKKGIVKFNGLIEEKDSMSIKEFAIRVLKIDLDNDELIAAFIGKELNDSYKKNNKNYELKQKSVKKNQFIGTIKKCI